jgi:hypothetical protein
LSEYLGVENISNLSVEEVKAILEEKSTAAAAEIETEEEGKRMKALQLKTEKNMCLPRCPAVRCLGVPKTQKSGCKIRTLWSY